MFCQTVINKRLKDLIIGRRLTGRYLPRSDLSFVKTGTTDENFHQEEKQDSAKHFFYNLASTGESSGEHILMAVILQQSDELFQHN